MNKTDISVIGAGAAGLMAARLLAKAGKKVVVLEARDRIGGRINTIYNEHSKVELGAEFVHGDLPVTLDLLNHAGIKYHAAGGDFWQVKDGTFSKEEEQIEGWGELMIKMQKLRDDITMDEFLGTNFAEEKYETLRNEVRRYVSGYDTADPADASVFALREEWLNEDEGAQHRLDNGYCEMINYLVNEIKFYDGDIRLNTQIKKVTWSSNKVEAKTVDDEVFTADKIIIALPLGIMKLHDADDDAILFEPPIQDQQRAFKQIGFGAIIKVLLRFKTKFWERVEGNDLSDAAFFMSTETVPTWWTQVPQHENLLTGWLGGNPARQFIDASDEEILAVSLASLSGIFGIGTDVIKSLMTEWHVANWTADKYTRGSYAYDMVGSGTARQLLNKGVSDAIYFAGEYLYHGPAMGTVEAALTSAKEVAERIIKI